MAGMIFLIGHKEREGGGSRAARREEQNDFPVSLSPSMRQILLGRGSSFDKLRVVKPCGTPIKAGGHGNLPEVVLISPGGRHDEKGMAATMHNMTVLGLFDPVANKFTPPAVQIKAVPQTAYAAPT